MKTIFAKFFSPQIPDDERMFNLACLLSSVFALLFVLAGILIRLSPVVTFVCFLAYIVCSILFFVQQKWHKTTINILIMLILNNWLGFPFAMIFSELNTAEFVVYYLIGITFGLVLLKGKIRIIYLAVLFAIDISSMVYTFLYRMPYEIYYGPLDYKDYLRMEFSVIATGVVCGAIVLFRNRIVTEQMKAREEAGKVVEDMSFAQDMFLVTVSHEIRTPLNAIIGTTDSLLESDASNHIKEMAFNISNSSHALLSITSDLLDFSIMDTDKVKLIKNEYDFALILNDVINLMNVRLLDSEISLFVDINPNIPKVLIGDSGKVRQILVNMLSNAIKYTKSGYILVKVDFLPLVQNTLQLSIDVKDTGIGIKPEMIEKIFEAYNRSGEKKTDISIEGNGLGLALCKRLAKSMDGSIWAESEYGKGSTFHLKIMQEVPDNNISTCCGSLIKKIKRVIILVNKDSELEMLPNILMRMNVAFHESKSIDDFVKSVSTIDYDYYMVDAKNYEDMRAVIPSLGINMSKFVVISDANYSYSEEPFDLVVTKPISCLNISDLLNQNVSFALRKQTYEGNFSIPNATILIVDDNLVNLQVASNILSRYECNIITAASGKESLICLEQEKIDLVFLDYMMPEMDGIDTLKKIRQFENPSISNIPAVALTANVVSGAREFFMNAGFDGYLSKPIEIDKMEKALLSFLPSEMVVFK